MNPFQVLGQHFDWLMVWFLGVFIIGLIFGHLFRANRYTPKQAGDFDDKMVKLQRNIDVIKMQIGEAILPILESLITQITETTKKHLKKQ